MGIDMQSFAARIVVLACLLAGCTRLYGIMRMGYIEAAPDLACVRALLERREEVTGLYVEDSGGSRRLTWRGLAPPDSAPTFNYEIARRVYRLRFKIDADRPVRVYHAAYADPDASVSELRDIQSRLISIEGAVQQQCAVPGFVAALEQTCRGEHCDELEARAAQRGAAAHVARHLPTDFE
jgi:hypothetical protein